MSNPTVSIEVANTSNYIFSNTTSNYDIVVYPSYENQRLLFGTKSNVNAGLLLSSSNIAMTLQPSTSNNSISFYAGNSNLLMTVLGSGNVGIGKAYPGYALDVAGTINATSVLVGGSALQLGFWQTSNAITYSMSNVGINTTTPGYGLDINSNTRVSGAFRVAQNAQNQLTVESDPTVTYSTSLLLRQTGASDGIVGKILFNGYQNVDQASCDIRFLTMSNNGTLTERMVVSRYGTVGIGTTSPNSAYKLDVNGTINATALTIAGSALSTSVGGGFTAAGTNTAYTTCNIGIGTATPAQLLHVAGNLQIDSNLYLTNTKFTFQGVNIKKNTSSGVTNVSTSITSIPGYTWNSNVILNASNSNYSVSTQIGSTEYMRVNGNGNVGIGSASPAYNLDITGTLRNTGNHLTTGGYVGIGNNITATLSNVLTNGLILSGTDNSMAGPHFQAYTNRDAFPVFQQLNWQHDNICLGFDCFWTASGFLSGSNVAQYQIYKVGGKLNFNYGAAVAAGATSSFSTTLCVQNTNVGIGNSSPAYTLDVSGQARVNSTVDYAFSVTQANTNGANNYSRASQMTNSSLSTNEAYINILGQGSGVNNQAYTGFIYAGNNSASNTFTIGFQNSDRLFNFQANGNVGIGTTSPVYKMDVSGTGHFTGALYTDNLVSFNNNAGLALPTTGSNGGSGDRIVLFPGGSGAYPYSIGMYNATLWYSAPVNCQHMWCIGGSAVMTLSNTGTSAILTTTGDLCAFGSVSDQRLKENVVGLAHEDCLDKVSQLRPVEFDWNSECFNDSYKGTHDIGFIAQEVEKIIPQATKDVDFFGDTYKTIKYERIVPLLVGAIKKLQEKNSRLEALYKGQSTELESLRNDMAKVKFLLNL